MVFPRSLGATGRWRTALGASVAGLGTCALGGYIWWSYRGGRPRLDGFAGILIAFLILIAIGTTAGLVSGRFRDALASWVAAVIGSMLAYEANYAIDPNWPRSDTPFEAWIVLAAVFMLPLIAGGHLLGIALANRGLRKAEVGG